MDVLADVFAALRIGPLVFAHVELASPWGMAFSRSDKTGFHVVLRGQCWLRSPQLPAPVRLDAGDTVFLPHGWTHSLADTPTRRAEPYEQVVARRHTGGAGARLLCGAYALGSEAPHTLLKLLPPLLHVRRDDAAHELKIVVDLLAQEARSNAPGATAATARCADMILIYALRAWLAAAPDTAGWLGALRDREIGSALGLVHADVARAWTVEKLARSVGMSRANFARRFTKLVGMAPLAYLAQWRMTLAARQIRDTDHGFAAIAEAVGYESESAFHRAFRRLHASSPGAYRRRARLSVE